VANFDDQLPPGPDWLGRKIADIERAIQELGAARTIEATIGDVAVSVADLQDAVGTLPAPGQVARRDEANTFALSARFSAVVLLGPSGNVLVQVGTGDPEGVVTADVGSLFLRTDGGAGTVLNVKESGSGTPNGWVPK